MIFFFYFPLSITNYCSESTNFFSQISFKGIKEQANQCPIGIKDQNRISLKNITFKTHSYVERHSNYGTASWTNSSNNFGNIFFAINGF